MMQIADVEQGSPEWHALRARHFCASDAPAMMGISKHKSRAALLRALSSGAEEPGEHLQRVFDRGHETEVAIREHAESVAGAELYPSVCTREVDGLALLASCDGLSMDGKIVWEHKQWNIDLAASVAAGCVPASYRPQLDQQALVTGAERVLFMCSDGTAERCCWTWYVPEPDSAARLIAGWKMLAEDLAAFAPAEVVAAPVAAPVAALPALVIDIEGAVKASNLVAYREAVVERIRAIKTDLTTDQDFADAEEVIKALGSAETEIEMAKRSALARTATIDDLFRAIDQLREEMRTKRLALEKSVKARKESIRGEIASAAQAAFTAHVGLINRRIGGRAELPQIAVDFVGAMKGKKTVDGLRDGVDRELIRAKLAASEAGDLISINLAALDASGAPAHLFPDLRRLATKQADDFAATIRARVAEAEEAERRIRAAREKAEAERVEAERAAADLRAREAAAPPVSAAPERAPVGHSMPAASAPAVVSVPAAPAVAPYSAEIDLARGEIIAALADGVPQVLSINGATQLRDALTTALLRARRGRRIA